MLLKVGGKGGGGHVNIQTAYFPECTLFHQEIEGDEIVVTYRAPAAPRGREGEGEGQPAKTTMAAPQLRVPLSPGIEGRETVDVKLFGSAASTYRMGEPYDSWFSARFGYEVILVYIGDSRRPVLAHSPNNNKGDSDKSTSNNSNGPSYPKQGWLSSITSYISGSTANPQQHDDSDFLTFNEAAPFLVTSRASLRDVSSRLPPGEEADMVVFRPNIVVDDDDGHEDDDDDDDDGKGKPLEAWEEDYWAELLVGGSDDSSDDRGQRLALTANCARCISINIDYETGRPAEGERGSVLKKLMGDRRVDRGDKWSPIFGRYAFLLTPPTATTARPQGGRGAEGDMANYVAVGDEVRVTRRISDRDVWSWPKDA